MKKNSIMGWMEVILKTTSKMKKSKMMKINDVDRRRIL
jgi:hypothetical protein